MYLEHFWSHARQAVALMATCFSQFLIGRVLTLGNLLMICEAENGSIWTGPLGKLHLVLWIRKRCLS